MKHRIWRIGLLLRMAWGDQVNAIRWTGNALLLCLGFEPYTRRTDPQKLIQALADCAETMREISKRETPGD